MFLRRLSQGTSWISSSGSSKYQGIKYHHQYLENIKGLNIIIATISWKYHSFRKYLEIIIVFQPASFVALLPSLSQQSWEELFLASSSLSSLCIIETDQLNYQEVSFSRSTFFIPKIMISSWIGNGILPVSLSQSKLFSWWMW